MSFRQLDVSSLLNPPDPDRPRGLPERSGDGPLEASSCVALAVSPEVIWDVNGYYQALGFSWPYQGITKKDLRLAYHAVGGENSVYLTRVFKLLLDEKERRAYDASPFGMQRMDSILRQLTLEKARRIAAQVNPSTDNRATQDEVLKELFDRLGYEHYPNEQYPNGEEVGHTEDLPVDHLWRWGYYRWGTSKADVTTLETWQKLLVSQLAALEVTIKVCVGYIGRGRTDSRFVVARTYGVRTVYLREDQEPDDEMASAAAKTLLADLTQ